MVRLTHKVLAFFVFVFAAGLAIGQQQASIKWDLSYKSILEQNKVADDAEIRQWLSGIKSPAERWVKDWRGKPINSAILIEYPAFHAAERQTIWLVRTADEAHYWELTEGLGSTKWADEAEVEEPFSLKIYDEAFKAAWAWQQLAPKSAKDLPDQVFPGYMGFISFYGPEGSKQMLLTFEDFIDCPSKACARAQTKPGRLMAALQPILTPESHKNYKHKSEAEIAAMTPEQRLDELFLENDVHPLWATDDKHSDLISKYSQRDGSKRFPHLAKLIDSYHPKRKKSDKSFVATMMANDIDSGVLRLRSSAEGRGIIKAIERMTTKMRDHNGPDSQVGMTLRFVTGTNLTDDAIRDTLWLRHRIKLTDEEFLAFINYLIETDPTYPSWSERKFEQIRDADAREVNDLGVPVTQVFVMKNPERFYKMYLAFTKNRVKD